MLNVKLLLCILRKCKNILLICFIGLFLLTLNYSEANETVNPTCKNLHKVKDMDDLLFQFYSNLDNQCLFQMPTKELEKAWGINILDYINLSSDEKSKLNTEFQKIIENGEGLFIKKVDFEQGIAAFDIYLTKKYVDKNKGWGGSVGKGLFPKLLPPPQRVNDLYDDTLEDMYIPGSKPIAPKNTVYEKNSKYYWLNKNQVDNQPVLLFETGYFPSPMQIILYSQARILDYK